MGVDGGVNLLKHLPRGRSFNPNVDEGQDAIHANKSDGLVMHIDARATKSGLSRVKHSTTNLEFGNGPTWNEWSGNPNVGTQAETVAEIGEDPWGRKSLLFISRNNDVGSNFEGGWNSSVTSIDRTKEHRITFWINVRKKGSNGTIYTGMYMNGSGFIHRTTGNVQGNPYFSYVSHTNSLFNEGEWLMLCYCIKPAGTSANWTQPSYTGGYRPDGTRIQIGSGGLSAGNTEGGGMFSSTTTTVQNRTYLYYSTDPSVEVDWFWPRMDVVEGNEPTPQEMLDSPHDCINCLAGSGVNFLPRAANTATTGPTLVPGKYWDFAGGSGSDSDFLRGNNLFNHNVTDKGLSLVFWVNFDDIDSPRALIEKGAVNTSYSVFLYNNDLTFRTVHGGWPGGADNLNLAQPANHITVGTWHMLAFTWDRLGDSKKRIYIDGVEKAVSSANTTAIDSNNSGLHIGCLNVPQWHLDGKLASVKIYKIGINHEQILHEYNSMHKYFRNLS
mgnify:CR=1 FL=1|tara:strand:- start:277 stop:1770 length:1494 start_codon:yes stop_codon:yes gene_type:complete